MKTEILATIGPASINLLEAMKQAELGGIRINSSHSDTEFQKNVIQQFRKIQPDGYIVYDIKGPKVRLGDFPEAFPAKTGQEVILRTDVPIAPGRRYPMVEDVSGGLPLGEPELALRVKPGHRLLIDDGYVGLIVQSVESGKIVCKVMYGDFIRPRKGLNHPDTVLNFPYTMPEDEPLLDFAIQQQVHFIADSFTRNADDVKEMRDRLHGTRTGIISKIENPEAVKNFEAILRETDAVMIARGDLGVEIDPWKLPELQKWMIDLCSHAGKPVITATQMLESMIDNPHPSRADVSDIANAIYDGTDVIMLSGETSIGRYPVACVRMMRQIADTVEETERFRSRQFRRCGLKDLAV